MSEAIRALLELQSGVISRDQAMSAGMAPHDIRRMLRRREWSRVYDGVFVAHTGPLTWLQRAWAGVLFAAPAALCCESAVRAADDPGRRGRDEHAPIWVGIDRKRSVVEPPGVRIHCVSNLHERVQWNRSPPRVRIEHALLDIAAKKGQDFHAIASLADAVQSRRTTAPRLLDALGARQRIARRKFLESALVDIAEGTCSVLEHGYLTRVERPHGLPRGSRQAVAWTRGRIYRDVDYPGFGLLVELDGRLFHDDANARDRDLDRDLDAAISQGRVTVRLGWGQVFGRPCATAAQVGVLLTRGGWSGQSLPCPACLTPT